MSPFSSCTDCRAVERSAVKDRRKRRPLCGAEGVLDSPKRHRATLLAKKMKGAV